MSKPFTSGKLERSMLDKNMIVKELDESEFEEIIASGSLVTLPVRSQIYWPNEPIDTVYFPIDSVLSIVNRMRDGAQIEVGTVGREGVSAIPLLLGGTTSANESYCQVPGTAISIDQVLFRTLMNENPRFRSVLNRFVQAYVNTLGQLAACNRLHNINERAARWLLMTQDRVGDTKIRLTHEYLAMMLGSQRSGVTIAVGILQKAGFIRAGHGVITILDRPGLEASSCECYDVARAQFDAILQPAIASGIT